MTKYRVVLCHDLVEVLCELNYVYLSNSKLEFIEPCADKGYIIHSNKYEGEE